MMTDDEFFERLRHDAQHLQFTSDEVTASRLAARVRSRIAAPPTVAGLLAGWLRPLAAMIVAVAIGAALSLTWLERNHDNPTVEQMAANTSEVSVDGVSFGGSE